MIYAAVIGFGAGLSLILAIGAQNAFVLRQGLVGAHVLPICLICALSDAFFIAAGVAGAGVIASEVPWLIDWLLWAGAAFLIVYGGAAAMRALSPGQLVALEQRQGGRCRAILTCLALTWLNPHVYLDTVGLLGAVSTRFAAMPLKAAFGGGAMAASVVFFFALGYGARLVAPLLATPRCWALLDGGIAVVMWTIAATLIGSAIG